MSQSIITISSEAKEQILVAVNSPNLPANYGLRLGLKGSACSAVFIIGLDKPTEHDEIHAVDGIEVIIDKRHLMYLIGVRVGYEQTDDGVGFTIQK